MARTPTETVESFCAAWSRLDIEELMAFFTDDAVYHNMPGPPATGKAAVRATIERFLGGWQSTEWEVLNIAASGSVVFAERVDRIVAEGKQIDLPVAGVFKVEGDRIRAWRDYFDLATYTRTMQG
jgi:limonene-1,2-epoxide hydrolase